MENDSIREQLEQEEAVRLSPYACKSAASRGRLGDEDECDIRTCFQRDRDRVIHSKTFRRLKHKTQVFLAPAGDHYRTRLTHVLEVAQIARTIACALRYNEYLTEAIALGHDLGHTPFGHAGETVLNELYPGGFRHYEQSLRVVDVLEKKGRGLNLTFEVRDGIVKHSKGRKKILPDDLENLPLTIEGQVVRIADIIAYVNHDLDDAMRAGIVTAGDIPAGVRTIVGDKHSARINTMVFDLIKNTASTNGERLAMSAGVAEAIDALRDFLYEKVYDAHRVHDDFIKAEKIMRELYDYFLNHDETLESSEVYDDSIPKHRRVCDFIAGMTDLYALDLYTGIFLPKPWSVK